MNHFSMRSLLLAAITVCVVILGIPTQGLSTNDNGQSPSLGHFDWQSFDDLVEFHLAFENLRTLPSDPQVGQLRALPFGAYLSEKVAVAVGEFEIPMLQPGETFTIILTVPLSSLPPTAGEILPGQNNGNGNAPGAFSTQQVGSCPADDHWDGNIDVFWQPQAGGSGGGQVFGHLGTLQICPGAGASYIHVLMDCPDPAGITWKFNGLCPGWNADLVKDDGAGHPAGTAPNPIPGPGLFDGWICITADASVPIGSTCHFTLDLVCGSLPAQITLWATACDWTPPVQTESKSWGELKVEYR